MVSDTFFVSGCLLVEEKMEGLCHTVSRFALRDGKGEALAGVALRTLTLPSPFFSLKATIATNALGKVNAPSLRRTFMEITDRTLLFITFFFLLLYFSSMALKPSFHPLVSINKCERTKVWTEVFAQHLHLSHCTFLVGTISPSSSSSQKIFGTGNSARLRNSL